MASAQAFASSDPADFITYSLDGVLSVRLAPASNFEGAMAGFGMDGVSGFLAHVEFTPTAGFGGPALVVETRVGASMHQPAANDLMIRAGELGQQMGDAFLEKYHDGIFDGAIQSDVTRLHELLVTFNQVYETNGLHINTTALSATIESMVDSYTPGSEFLAPLKALGEDLSDLAHQWGIQRYFMDTGGGIQEVSQTEYSAGMEWFVTAGSIRGGLEITGYTGNYRVVQQGDALVHSYEILPANLGLTTLYVESYTSGITEGTAGNDVLNGTNGADIIHAGSGDDTVRGGSGADSLYGEGGNDVLKGESGTDSLYGRAGNDKLSGGAGHDLLAGGGGNDRMLGGGGNDTLLGGAGRDVLRGGPGDDVLRGGPGNDVLIGDAGNDKLVGGGGEDIFRFFVGDGDDRIQGFQNDIDLIDVSDYGFGSGAQVVAMAHAHGNHTVIDLNGDLITLLRFDFAELDGGDFIV